MVSSSDESPRRTSNKAGGVSAALSNEPPRRKSRMRPDEATPPSGAPAPIEYAGGHVEESRRSGGGTGASS
eukprot:7903613-Pyramimonas_sp.AAC.1